MTRTLPRSLGLAALWLAAIAQPCAAEAFRTHEVLPHDPAQVVRATTIDYSDLDVTSARDLASLLSRIEAAAEAVCGRPTSGESRSERQDYSQCRGRAIDQAVRATRLPRLKMLAAAREAAQVAAN